MRSRPGSLRETRRVTKTQITATVQPGFLLSALDMRGGQEAGMATAAALYGYGRRGALLETGPDFVIEDAAWTRVVRLSGGAAGLHEGRIA